MTHKYRNALPAGEEAAGSGDAPTPTPVAVQNYAYLKLLKWDHLHRPFPEVSAAGSLTTHPALCASEPFKKNSVVLIEFKYQKFPFNVYNPGF